MIRSRFFFPLLTVALGIWSMGSNVLEAQSSTRLAPKSSASGSSTRSATPSGSGNRAGAAASKVGLQGYCPVCVVDMRKWVRGNPSIQASYDGKTYYFPGDEQRRKFLANPEKYVPAAGGDCAVCLKDMGMRTPGNVHYSAISRNRLYLFPNAEMKQKFVSNPARYVDADLAYDGKCSVCRVEMHQDVPGDPNVAVRYKGLKYQFMSKDQLKMFLANPDKYAVGKKP